MIKIKEFRIALFIFVLFILFQAVFSLISSENFLGRIGVLQMFFMFTFLFSFVLCRTLAVKGILVVIVIYQILLVGVLFEFFLLEYDDPLGFNPKDAAYYHDLAIMLRNLPFQDVIFYISKRLDLGDYGYPFVLQSIYRISGSNPVVIAKFFNIFFHCLTCYYLVKISEYLFEDTSLKKNLLILYGLNPATVFFLTSGLKEPLFAFVVVLGFYYSTKAYFRNSTFNYILAGGAILLSGLFRSAYPVFIVISILIFTLWNSQGKYRRIKQIGLLAGGALAIVGAYSFVQTELSQKLNYDFDAIAEHRMGRKPSLLDYMVMLVGGVIGPFPSFDFNKANQLGLLQTAGNFIKIIFSYFFIVGAFLALKNRIRLLYVAIIFIFINVIVLVPLAASLDYRFLYPFLPLYFLILAYGYTNYNKKLLPFYLKSPLYISGVIGLIILYNFR